MDDDLIDQIVALRVKRICYDAENSTSYAEEIEHLLRSGVYGFDDSTEQHLRELLDEEERLVR